MRAERRIQSMEARSRDGVDDPLLADGLAQARVALILKREAHKRLRNAVKDIQFEVRKS